LSKLKPPTHADDADEVQVGDASEPSTSPLTDADSYSTAAAVAPVDSISVTVSIVDGYDEYVASNAADKTSESDSHMPAIV